MNNNLCQKRTNDDKLTDLEIGILVDAGCSILPTTVKELKHFGSQLTVWKLSSEYNKERKKTLYRMKDGILLNFAEWMEYSFKSRFMSGKWAILIKVNLCSI